MAEHNDTGKTGEQLAVEFLEKSGYEILEKNWRFKKFEIDIIAKKNKTLIIAEVKTRHGNHFGEPEEWVTRAKQKNLIQGAQAYILQKDIDFETQFDIISIVIASNGTHKINHIQDAFYPTA